MTLSGDNESIRYSGLVRTQTRDVETQKHRVMPGSTESQLLYSITIRRMSQNRTGFRRTNRLVLAGTRSLGCGPLSLIWHRSPGSVLMFSSMVTTETASRCPATGN